MDCRIATARAENSCSNGRNDLIPLTTPTHPPTLHPPLPLPPCQETFLLFWRQPFGNCGYGNIWGRVCLGISVHCNDILSCSCSWNYLHCLKQEHMMFSFVVQIYLLCALLQLLHYHEEWVEIVKKFSSNKETVSKRYNILVIFFLCSFAWIIEKYLYL